MSIDIWKSVTKGLYKPFVVCADNGQYRRDKIVSSVQFLFGPETRTVTIAFEKKGKIDFHSFEKDVILYSLNDSEDFRKTFESKSYLYDSDYEFSLDFRDSFETPTHFIKLYDVTIVKHPNGGEKHVRRKPFDYEEMFQQIFTQETNNP